MTIRITVKNEDSRESALIKVQTLYQEKNSVMPVLASNAILKGGESTEMWIYGGHSVLVEEEHA